MNLVEQIYKGVELIVRGKALGKDTAPIKDKVETLQAQLSRDVEELKLSEFRRRDLAVEIYSEVLGCDLWLCSNDRMAAQIRQDSPGAVCYTTDELESLISLHPGPDNLKRIHDNKTANLSHRAMKTTKKTDGGVSIES